MVSLEKLQQLCVGEEGQAEAGTSQQLSALADFRGTIGTELADTGDAAQGWFFAGRGFALRAGVEDAMHRRAQLTNARDRMCLRGARSVWQMARGRRRTAVLAGSIAASADPEAVVGKLASRSHSALPNETESPRRCYELL